MPTSTCHTCMVEFKDLTVGYEHDCPTCRVAESAAEEATEKVEARAVDLEEQFERHIDGLEKDLKARIQTIAEDEGLFADVQEALRVAVHEELYYFEEGA